jgi:nucleotidyltransferase substrate binding protein (TIGR01987 family)
MDPSPLDLTPLRNAIAALNRALDLIEDEEWFGRQSAAVRETLLAGVIQHFEFVYELSVKMLRRHLERTADDPTEIDAVTFRDMVRIGGEKGLIEDVEAWFEYRRMRNFSSHTYDQAKAWVLYHGVAQFLPDARDLLARLEARNA